MKSASSKEEEPLDQETKVAIEMAEWASLDEERLESVARATKRAQDDGATKRAKNNMAKESNQMPRQYEGSGRRGSGVVRERTGHALGPRGGTRGGRHNPNVEWHCKRADAIKAGMLARFLRENPKPEKKG